MIRTLLIGAAFLLPANCTPPVDTTPTPPAQREKPDCQATDVILRYSWEDLDPLNCDLNPPQILAVRIDEMQSDYDRCHDSGGSILYDDEVYAIYCINLDY